MFRAHQLLTGSAQEPRWTFKILPAYLPTALAKAKMKTGLQPDQDLVRQGHLPSLESLLPLMAEALWSAKPLFLWRKPAANTQMLSSILGADTSWLSQLQPHFPCPQGPWTLFP